MLKKFFFDNPIYYTIDSYEPNYLVGYIQNCVIDGDAAELLYENGVYYINTRNGRHICGTPEDLNAYYLYHKWAEEEYRGLYDLYYET